MGLSVLVFLLLAAVWVYQFTGFMLLDDRVFPGAYDKLIWGAAFILFFPVTPFAFMCWRASYAASVEGEQRRE